VFVGPIGRDVLEVVVSRVLPERFDEFGRILPDAVEMARIEVALHALRVDPLEEREELVAGLDQEVRFGLDEEVDADCLGFRDDFLEALDEGVHRPLARFAVGNRPPGSIEM